MAEMLCFVFRLLFKSWPEMKVNFKNIFAPKIEGEGKVAMLTTIALDPQMIRKTIHEIEGDYKITETGTLLPRDWDLFVRCSTELGHRGAYPAALFDRWFSGTCLNSQPEKYGACPYGKWEKLQLEEPHFMMRDIYPSQVEEMEAVLDASMEQYVGKRVDIGEVLRKVYWDVFMVSSYGVGPNEDTAKLLEHFDGHYPEFDYAVRMSSAKMVYEWPDSLAKHVKEIGDYCWRVTLERKANLKDYADKNDILTNMLREYPDMDTAKMEGALRGQFTGGVNNAHSAVCGAIIQNAYSDDGVYEYYIKDPMTHIEHITRESLRLYNSIPASRKVQPQDNFVLDGKKLEAGSSVILSTFAMNTDPRSHEDPLDFKPERFQKDMDSLGYMCSRGFAPYGIPTEMGGRPCGARFHNTHMINTVIGKLLKSYTFTKPSGGHDFKQQAATSRYIGNAKVTIGKR